MAEPQVSPEQIQTIRSNFLKELQTKGQDFVHPKDLERIQTDDSWLRRFLLHHDCDQQLALNMIMDTCKWRKEFGTNELSESNVKMENLIDGGFFPHGRDIDGSLLFIFKCKKHVKGAKDINEVKRCVVYWMERIERQEKGKPITLFFDMEGCGLSNMDIEFTSYLINLFKLYYPYFLNYIIILEMAWILNAAFKIIKGLLPEKAIEKLKIIKKPNLKDYVPIDQQLECWGGTDSYVFSFIPENREAISNSNNASTSLNNSKKVHFADGSPINQMPEVSGAGGEFEGNLLVVKPPDALVFVRDGNELTSSLELQSKHASQIISYKIKTTSPEKFRVRPTAGCLAPGDAIVVQVALLKGFQLGGLSRDKFLIMSMPVESTEMSSSELTDLWKNVSGKNVTQHRLSCVQDGYPVTNNGNAMSISAGESDINLNQLSSNVSNLVQRQDKLYNTIKTSQNIQMVTICLIMLLAGLVMHLILRTPDSPTNVCYKEPSIP